jgi:preprotein translocase subunit YajC
VFRRYREKINADVEEQRLRVIVIIVFFIVVVVIDVFAVIFRQRRSDGKRRNMQ